GIRDFHVTGVQTCALPISEALERLRPGGLVVVAGGKTDGAASLAKRMAGLGEIEGRASKHHGVVFWLRRGGESAGVAAALRAARSEERRVGKGWSRRVATG